MKDKRKKPTGAKQGGLTAGLVLILGLAFFLLPPCWGMDALTQSELGDLSGQTGIDIAFGGTSTVEAVFNSLSYGDPDGMAFSQDDNAGWIVLIGNGSNSGYLTVTIPDGARMSIDSGTTGNTVCTPAGTGALGIAIPANTAFLTFTLTSASIGLQDPTTVYVKGSHSAVIAPNQMETVAFLWMENLAINKADMVSRCYVWAHTN